MLAQVRSRATLEAFCRLHEDGSIYRANRLVNFCPYLNTTLSNLEVRPCYPLRWRSSTYIAKVDMKEFEKRTLIDLPGYAGEKVEVGCITSFKYMIDGTDEFIIVATTRPETMLGDTAIAVNPKDERYKVRSPPARVSQRRSLQSHSIFTANSLDIPLSTASSPSSPTTMRT